IVATGRGVVASVDAVAELRIGDALDAIAALAARWRADTHHPYSVDATPGDADQAQARDADTGRRVDPEHAGAVGHLGKAEHAVATRVRCCPRRGGVVAADHAVAMLGVRD